MSGDSLTPVGRSAANEAQVVGATSPALSQLDANLAAMTSLSAEAIDRIRGVAPGDVPPADRSTSGLPVITVGGRPLDSRRDPVSVAERAASAIPHGPVVML